MSNAIAAGAYVGTPAVYNPGLEATFEAQYASFTNAVGTAPKFLDAYIDNSNGWSGMVASSQWDANSFAASPVASNTIPVIGLPMALPSDWGRSTEDIMNQISSGAEDDVLRGVVQAWQSAGISTIYLRPGYEMDGNYMPWSMGNDAQSVASWVAAFQHISEVTKSVPGENVEIVWNPALTNVSPVPVPDAYPGDQYVDVVGLDIYNSLYPFDLTDWSTGGTDSSIAQWESNPANQDHYYNYPAASAYSPTGDANVEWGLQQAIDFAAAHGKPFAIPEVGVGYDGVNADSNDPTLPQLIDQELTAAGAPQTAFVAAWDMYNWQFSGGAQPATAAGWAQVFSSGAAAQPAPAVTPTAGATIPITVDNTQAAAAGFLAGPAATTAGSGPDTVDLQLSEDAWQGNAQFVFSVDGVAQNSPTDVTALAASDQEQDFIFQGDWNGGSGHSFNVSYVNDAYGGSPDADRNLIVNSVAVDGTQIAGPTVLWSNATV